VTAPGPAPACGRCGAPMAPEQDWCLECGHAATTRLLRPPSWRLPVAIVLAVMALVGGAVALAVASLGDDADRVASRPVAPLPTATAERPSAGTGGATTATEPADTVPGAAEAAGSDVPEWPEDLVAFTVVLDTAASREQAEQRARALVEGGADAGILSGERYASFDPAQWVVWRGRYERADRDKADEAAAKLRAAGLEVSVVLVRPRA